MSRRAGVISGAVLAALALGVGRLVSPPAKVPPAEPVAVSQPSTAPRPPALRESGSTLRRPDEHPPAESVPDATPLDERALVGTKWEREGFSLEFGADGRLLIGGRERARWRVEGSRVQLHRDATGEEHWLDIVGQKLLWEGQEIGRVRP